MNINYKSEFNTHNIMDKILNRLSKNKNVLSLGQAPPRSDRIKGAVGTYWVTTEKGTVWIVPTQSFGDDRHLSQPSHILVGHFTGPYKQSRFHTYFSIPMKRDTNIPIEQNINDIVEQFFKGGKA